MTQKEKHKKAAILCPRAERTEKTSLVQKVKRKYREQGTASAQDSSSAVSTVSRSASVFLPSASKKKRKLGSDTRGGLPGVTNARQPPQSPTSSSSPSDQPRSLAASSVTKKSRKNKLAAPHTQAAEGPADHKTADVSEEGKKSKDSRKEIDDLFADVMQAGKKQDGQKREKRKETAHSKAGQKKKRRPLTFDEDMGLNQRAINRTADGLRIYTEEELGIGKGGGTPECPFDCSCCF
ncbi:hypothetical protein TGPRC2_306195 [Toxoplasma gondii TgCatPRC2]|uniref:DUF1764 domain-containing protein n=5 Tax=Toxoplasma gondii TaxID=5811 RepID=A0A0F7V7Z9_TOXGV|nr:hypothetical protein TGME49_306195 [Toxoplasma gondii ME49]ESS28999.1 hypothetical protein TGVEG_306195 [Toxoplasma gondii VEG]KYF44712.1 hypothetical protein TGARI_306195 [Toxoplasma gondii ARI]KYK64643.1 hypothetical protein TGPRC2_306195 [Toxoplasma gondii TgCatPRC2]PIL97117.1 hypothetical protein TGCOUG_306195 [Toxoplasma gondii COUG]EPT27442.1 hypothetical protein TGME49_306195 [Toxoplasma gondii ME49]|eukprot:XP_018636160.1 hypothetical protein TGME49_306195 [Toxoplasma gondii ME49]